MSEKFCIAFRGFRRNDHKTKLVRIGYHLLLLLVEDFKCCQIHCIHRIEYTNCKYRKHFSNVQLTFYFSFSTFSHHRWLYFSLVFNIQCKCCCFHCLFPFLVNIMISLSRCHNFSFGFGVVIYYNSDRVYHRQWKEERERARENKLQLKLDIRFWLQFFQIIYSHKKEHIILKPNGAIKNLSIPLLTVCSLVWLYISETCSGLNYKMKINVQFKL